MRGRVLPVDPQRPPGRALGARASASAGGIVVTRYSEGRKSTYALASPAQALANPESASIAFWKNSADRSISAVVRRFQKKRPCR